MSMPWCEQCKCYHYSTARHTADIQFGVATQEAARALLAFRLAHTALLRTLEQKP